MVYKLRLKQTIIKRFINRDSDSDDESNGSDKEDTDCVKQFVINGGPKLGTVENDRRQRSVYFQTLNSTFQRNDKEFTNFKISVSNGPNLDTFDTRISDCSPFAVDSNLDQLISCRDLDQLEDVLLKTTDNLNNKTKNRKKSTKKQLTAKSLQNGNSSQLDSNEFLEYSESLKFEGIRKIKSKPSQLMLKCFVCELKLNGLQTALEHIKSDRHSMKKFGDDLRGIDALFTIDSESIGDVDIAIHRKKELKKISLIDKQRYLEHGIRLKDGFGGNAYICSECKLNFKSLREVKEHFQSFNSALDEPKVRDDGNCLNLILNKLDLKLKNEGIKEMELYDGINFYCVFCNSYFDCRKSSLNHIKDPPHRKRKSDKILNEISNP